MYTENRRHPLAGGFSRPTSRYLSNNDSRSSSHAAPARPPITPNRSRGKFSQTRHPTDAPATTTQLLGLDAIDDEYHNSMVASSSYPYASKTSGSRQMPLTKRHTQTAYPSKSTATPVIGHRAPRGRPKLNSSNNIPAYPTTTDNCYQQHHIHHRCHRSRSPSCLSSTDNFLQQQTAAVQTPPMSPAPPDIALTSILYPSPVVDVDIDKSSSSSNCNNNYYTQQQQQIEFMLRTKLRDSDAAYAALEQQFRQTLHVEGNRYSRLQRKHAQLITQTRTLHEQYTHSVQKEQKASQLLQQLTQVLREKLKEYETLQNTNSELRSTISEYDEIEDRLHALVDKNRELEAKCQLLTEQRIALEQQREKLQAQLNSYIAAAADQRERKPNESESDELRRQLATCEATLRETSAKLQEKEQALQAARSALAQLDITTADNANANNKLTALSRDFSEQTLQLERERLRVKKLEDALEYAVERKEQYKARCATIDEELASNRRALQLTKVKWQEKCAHAGELEHSIAKLKQIWDERINALQAERAEAVKKSNAASAEVERTKTHSEQRILSERHALVREIELVVAGKDDALRQAQHRVMTVEHEERLILRQMSQLQQELKDKQVIEQRLKRLESALHEARL